ncbi:MAG: PH domain-containing protein [Acidisphaera sp.]|nr:PH domain-containing protein [Acidisphaera sp.]
MKYYQRVIRPDERVAFFCSIHWIVYWAAIGFLVLDVVILLLLAGTPSGDNWHAVETVALIACTALALLAFLRAYSRRIGTEIVVTDRRIIFKRGLIARHTVEMNVSKIETVDVEQSLLGRVLGYGDVVIRGTGGTFEPLLRVDHPLDLRSAILVG